MRADRRQPTLRFRSWRAEDREACLSIFDANCPTYFAPNERSEFASFLDAAPDGYEVCELQGRIVGAGGLIRRDSGVSLNWIMLDPEAQGCGIGAAIMERVVSLARASGCTSISIAASHKSAAFFERFGAVATERTVDGWGPGMDRVDMLLAIGAA